MLMPPDAPLVPLVHPPAYTVQVRNDLSERMAFRS